MNNPFNDIAHEWDKPERVEETKLIADQLKTHLDPSKKYKILDLGCGTGLLGLNFFEYAFSLLGVDTSEKMLEIFDQKTKDVPNVTSHQLNLEKESLEGEFDLILSSMAFHHFEEPEYILQKLKNQLHPGGLIIIIDLDQEDGSFHPDNHKMGVQHFGFSKSHLEAWATNNDLKIKHYEIINKINKNSQTYQQFAVIFQ